MTVDEMLQGGIAAVKAGDMVQAAQLFTSVVQADPQSERGWLGLGLCQTEPKKQAYCFRRVLAINPKNPVAQKKLAALSASAPVPSTNTAPPAPVPAPRSAAPRGQSKPSRSGGQKKTRLVMLASVVVVLVFCGVGAAYLYASGQIAALASSVVALVKSPTPPPTNTFTPAPTATPTVTMTSTAVVTPTLTLNYRPFFERGSCMFAVPDGAKVDCGFVVVPEDREKNPAHTIRLAVAVYHGPEGNVAPDPVIFLHGGPGGNAVMWSSKVYATVVLPIVRERDLVVFDQRGAGLSTPPLQCPELTKAYTEDMQSLIASDKRESLYTNALLGCHDRLIGFGVDPAAYTTLASAADVRDILMALKYKQKANLYGISYGTRLAQMVMREYPEIVRSVVIDSVLPLEVKLYNQGSATSDYALRTLFQGCAADPACQSAYPNLETVYTDLVKQLDKEPVTVPVSLPLGGPTQLNLSANYKTTVTGLSLTNDLLWVLQYSELIPSVPQALYHIHNGDYSLLRYAASLPPVTLSDISMGAYLSINCHEQVYATTPEELGADLAKYPSTEAIATAHVYGSGDALFQICGLWQAKPLAVGENDPVVSDIPTLIVAGTYDPTTPPSFAQQVGSHLSRSYLFEFPDQGHGPTAGTAPCPLQVVTAFFNDPSVEPDRTCLKETKPVRFLTPYTGAPPLELSAYEDKKLGVIGLVPATWKDIGYGFFSRSASSLDQTQIGQQTDTSTIADWLTWLSKEFNAHRGFDETPIQTGERRANQFVWKLYHTTSEGLPVDLAFARSGSRTLLVLMQSYPDEQATMYETVFLPLVDAATFGTVTPSPTILVPLIPAVTPTTSTIQVPDPFINCASQNDIPAAECNALVALYNSTDGANWKNNKSWLKTRLICNNWYGVLCSNEHVKILQLGSNNMSGSIPTQLGSLTQLQILSLGNNALTGSIPTELGNLTGLTSLSVDNNHLTGPVPAELGNLTNLTDLELGNNQLTGSIPSQLGSLTNLTALGASSNQLTGSIPTEFGNLINLKRLSLSGNQLTGSIPSALGSLTQLQILTLNNNPLTGSIPTELSNLKQLQALFLGDTQLTGEIPASFVNLIYLSHLTLGCGLTSSDPTVIGFIDGILGSGWDVTCPT